MILGRAPLRISFAGGGTDLEEYHNKYTGYTVSATIDKYTYVIAKLRNDNKFQGFSPDFASHIPPNKHRLIQPLQGHEIAFACIKELHFLKGVDMFFCSDVKPGSGLGASSSLATNLIKVILELQKKKWHKDKIAMKAYNIARNILKWKIGKQDEFAAAYGGINFYTFTKNKVTTEPISLSRSCHQELQNNSLLFYLGTRKSASDVLKHQLDNMKKTNTITMSALHNTKRLAIEMRDALKQNNLTRFYSIINDAWQEKKKYTKEITNKKIELVSKRAFSKGALALKVTGAGGGGHFFVLAEPSKHEGIEKALRKLGVSKVDFNYQNVGATVIDLHNL